MTAMSAALSRAIDFAAGRLGRRTLLRIVFPLILASYFGTLIFAIRMFPGPFDWRTRSMSKLLYPDVDPQFHVLVSIGLAIAGLLMLPFAGYIGRRLRSSSQVLADVGAFALGVGAGSLTLSALLVFQPFHELLARSAGIGLGLGMLAFYACTVKGSFIDESHTRPRLLLAWSLVVAPALLIAMIRVLVGAKFRWSNPLYQMLQNRSYWHLGLWEWIASAAVFLFLLCAALFLPESE
jgi:hypothetical protein